jgi:hypothetical protein
VAILQAEGLILEGDYTSVAPPYLFFTEKPSNWGEFVENLDSHNSQLEKSLQLPEDKKNKLIECCIYDGLTSFLFLKIKNFESLCNRGS